MTGADRAAGVLQGAVDAVQGTAHAARSGDRDRALRGREEAAHERWAAGLPARNTFERDHFRHLEVQLAAGRMQLDRAAERAMTAEANREAGQ